MLQTTRAGESGAATERLVDCLYEFDLRSGLTAVNIDTESICWLSSMAEWLTDHLRELSVMLLGEEIDAVNYKHSMCGWRSRRLYGLDLAADPHRVGVWDLVVEQFPLRPGFRGVTWSRCNGYESPFYDGSDSALREEWMRKKEEYSYLRVSFLEPGSQTSSTSDEVQPEGCYDKHFEQMCLDCEHMNE